MQPFYESMRALLGGEFDDFVHSGGQPPHHGLRVNTLKISPDDLRALLPFSLIPVPWCAEGFIYPSDQRPAKSLAYHAGLFYIQEPSAMSPVVVLDARPGEAVLDLCAAPGGKSVQLAGQLGRQGLLVSNDPSASRSRALIRNLELAGVANAVVLNEPPNRLAAHFPGFFDAILVDAPCSGEGMFRRDADAAKAWAQNKPAACARTQQEILRYAAAMLKPGGRLVYSTCTFNTLENEEQITQFLAANADFELTPIGCAALGISPGFLPGTARIFPHRAVGEGHFIARLTKKTTQKSGPSSTTAACVHEKLPRAVRAVFDAFCGAELCQKLSGHWALHNRSLYSVPDGLPPLRGLRVARSGWYAGDAHKDRFVPSQALAMGLAPADVRHYISLPQAEALLYVKGQSFAPAQGFAPQNAKPWVLVGYEGHPLGWARWVDGRLKNHLPSGWVMR